MTIVAIDMTMSSDGFITRYALVLPGIMACSAGEARRRELLLHFHSQQQVARKQVH
jgi:hypothetical protein